MICQWGRSPRGGVVLHEAHWAQVGGQRPECPRHDRSSQRSAELWLSFCDSFLLVTTAAECHPLWPLCSMSVCQRLRDEPNPECPSTRPTTEGGGQHISQLPSIAHCTMGCTMVLNPCSQFAWCKGSRVLTCRGGQVDRAPENRWTGGMERAQLTGPLISYLKFGTEGAASFLSIENGQFFFCTKYMANDDFSSTH